MTPSLQRAELRQATAAAIKNEAREQMRQHGTAGISLRAIARQLNITAPAIYNYFPSLDDLITALIVDAFTDLAVAMETAGAASAGTDTLARIEAVLHAYREWAVTHPVDFQLIYGNPIPGYQAPAELTSPLAFRPFKVVFALYGQALASGALRLPAEYQPVPDSIRQHLLGWKTHVGLDLPDGLICLLIGGWARIHGLVLLELFNHSTPVIGDPAALFAYELRALHTRMGAG